MRFRKLPQIIEARLGPELSNQSVKFQVGVWPTTPLKANRSSCAAKKKISPPDLVKQAVPEIPTGILRLSQAAKNQEDPIGRPADGSETAVERSHRHNEKEKPEKVPEAPLVEHTGEVNHGFLPMRMPGQERHLPRTCVPGKPDCCKVVS
jgi:hypothetical protein